MQNAKISPVNQIASLTEQINVINQEIARRVSANKLETTASKSLSLVRDISPRGMKIALTRLANKLGLELSGVEVKTGVKTLHFSSDYIPVEEKFKIRQMAENHGYVLV